MKLKIIIKSNPIQKLNERFAKLGFRERSRMTILFPDNSFRVLKKYILDSPNIAEKIKECLLILTQISVRAKILHAIISCEEHEFTRGGRLENHACNDKIIKYFKQHPETIPEIIELLNEADKGKLLKQLSANNLNTGSHVNKEKDRQVAESTDIDSGKDEQLVLEVYRRFSLLSRNDKPHPLKMFDEKFSLEYLRGRIYRAGDPGKLMVDCLKKINHSIGLHNLLHLLLTPPEYDNSVIKHFDQKFLDSRFLTIDKKYRGQIISLLTNDPNRPFQTRAKNHMKSTKIIYPEDTALAVEKKEITKTETHQSSTKRKNREYKVPAEQHKPLKKLKTNSQSMEEDFVQQRINYLQKLKPSAFKNWLQSDTDSLAWFHDEFLTNPPDAFTSCDEIMIQDAEVNNYDQQVINDPLTDQHFTDQPKYNHDENPFLMFSPAKLASFAPVSTFESDMDEENGLENFFNGTFII